MKICNIPISLKKINGKSIVALDWSKNNIRSDKEYFTNNNMIVNLKTARWWKNKYLNVKDCNDEQDTVYNSVIYSGIYIIDKNFCKKNVVLQSNNKTDTLIKSQDLYRMIKDSIANNMYINIPEPDREIEFNILHAFSE